MYKACYENMAHRSFAYPTQVGVSPEMLLLAAALQLMCRLQSIASKGHVRLLSFLHRLDPQEDFGPGAVSQSFGLQPLFLS